MLAAVLRLATRPGQAPAGAGAHGEQAERGPAERRGVGDDDRAGAGRDAVRVAPSDAVASSSSGMPCSRQSGVDRRHGLAGADLGVGGLEHRGGDVTTRERDGIRTGVDPAAARRRAPATRRPGWSSSTERSVAPATTRAPARRRACRSPVSPVSRAASGLGCTDELVGAHPEPGGEHLTGLVEQRAGAPTGRVQPGGVGPAGGQRRPQGLRRRGVQGPPGGVEQTRYRRVEEGRATPRR